MHPLLKAVCSLVLVSVAFAVHRVYFDWYESGLHIASDYQSSRQTEAVIVGLIVAGLLLLAGVLLWAVPSRQKTPPPGNP